MTFLINNFDNILNFKLIYITNIIFKNRLVFFLNLYLKFLKDNQLNINFFFNPLNKFVIKFFFSNIFKKNYFFQVLKSPHIHKKSQEKFKFVKNQLFDKVGF